jgi:hypothetical protein
MPDIIWILLILIIFIFLHNILFLPFFEKLKIIIKTDKISKKHKYWLKDSEEKNIDAKGYPEDWNFRRNEIYYRYKGICQDCGIKVRRFHIHHTVPISQGGKHNLDNLILLCEDCHIKVHPEIKSLLIEKNKIKYNYILSNSGFRFRLARKLFNCLLCEEKIKIGSRYWGYSNYKICLRCYNKFLTKLKTA